MNTRTNCEAGVKLLGLYALMQFLALLPSAVYMKSMVTTADISYLSVDELMERKETFSPLFLMATSTSVLYLLAGIGLLTGAKKISEFLIRDESGLMLPEGLNTTRVKTGLFQLAGVFALITWFPELIQTSIRTLIYGTWQSPQIPLIQRFYSNWSYLVSPLAGSLLGLLLIFRAKGLLRLIRFTRPT